VQNKLNHNCIICNSSETANYYYPPNRFNDKLFSYYLCKKCQTAFIQPLPSNQDFDLIYGTEDHSYLKKLNQGEKLKFNYQFPKFNHQGYQIEFFEKYKYYKKGKSLLDIGCGSGFYMNYAKEKGLDCVGVEYSSEFATLLRDKTDLSIFSFSEFETKYEGKKFDLIHAGHILEHLTEPYSIFDFIKKYSHKDTIVIVDGPLENNFCLSRMLIQLGSKLKRKSENNYPPQHITFTNYNSQLLFFENNKLDKLNYKIVEQLHPFPDHFNVHSLKGSSLYLFGCISANFSMLNYKWGNIFHYAGKFK
jgi:SAM-dependent methyltransferase